MKFIALPLARIGFAAFSFSVATLSLQALETVNGTLKITEGLLVSQSVEVGTAQVGAVTLPAYTLDTGSILGITHIDQIAGGNLTTWNWLHDVGTGSKKVMVLESIGTISLYKTTDQTTPAIVLDAAGTTPVITIAGKKVATEGNIGTILSGTTTGNSLAIGSGAVTAGSSATAIGKSANANGNSASSVGAFATALGNSASAVGVASYANGDRASAVGAGAAAEGTRASSVGTEARATGAYASAIGTSASASGAHAYAGGTGAVAAGAYASATGASAQALANYASAVGAGAVARQTGQVALGSFNLPLDGALFMLGNGAGYNEQAGAEQRSNIFVIMKDGRGIFRGKNYIEPTPANPRPAQPEALTVEGSATIKGRLRIEPAGDLSMGDFTANPTP